MALDTKFFGRNWPNGIFSILDPSRFITGNAWWVQSTGTGATDSVADGRGTSHDKPLATWKYAVETAAAAGDTIFVMPGHAETIGVSAAAAITFSDIGVKSIGLGGPTTKPQILIDAYADTYLSITAADVVIENFSFEAGHANIAAGVIVSAAGCEILGCNFLENTANEDFLVVIQTTAAADQIRIHGNTFIGAGQGTECIELVGANTSAEITNNRIVGLFSVAAIYSGTALSTGVNISGNYINNQTTAGNDLAGAIDLQGNTTGFICDNMIYLGDDTDCLTSIDGGYCVRGGNRAANEYDQNGGVAGTAST